MKTENTKSQLFCWRKSSGVTQDEFSRKNTSAAAKKIKKDIRIEKFIIKKVIKHKLISDGDDFQIMINPTYDLRR